MENENGTFTIVDRATMEKNTKNLENIEFTIPKFKNRKLVNDIMPIFENFQVKKLRNLKEE